jgi:hypothetical protein
MTDQPHTPMRELDHRSSDGIDVHLLWSEDDGRVMVAVEDSRTGTSFAFEVHAGDRVIDAFHHPYSYAAWRGVDTGEQSQRDLLAA